MADGEFNGLFASRRNRSLIPETLAEYANAWNYDREGRGHERVLALIGRQTRIGQPTAT